MGGMWVRCSANSGSFTASKTTSGVRLWSQALLRPPTMLPRAARLLPSKTYTGGDIDKHYHCRHCANCFDFFLPLVPWTQLPYSQSPRSCGWGHETVQGSNPLPEPGWAEQPPGPGLWSAPQSVTLTAPGLFDPVCAAWPLKSSQSYSATPMPPIGESSLDQGIGLRP